MLTDKYVQDALLGRMNAYEKERVQDALEAMEDSTRHMLLEAVGEILQDLEDAEEAL